MPGYGFGFSKARKGPKGGPVLLQAISPSAGWNGTAGSGFGGAFGATPVDPTRTTAKPAMRLIVPPNQAYTENLLVGVYAAANNGGSLLDNMGLAGVRVHFEGSVVEVASPSFETFADANGNPVTYFGWWARLSHDGRNGLANLYFEGIPGDATMQSRVMGPFTFLPAETPHDYQVEVAPSQAEIAGQRYQTVKKALVYLAGVGADHPLVTISEGGSYNIENTGTLYNPDGFITIKASAPVTFGKTGYTTDVAAEMRPLIGGLHFCGNNITFDIRFMSELRADGRDYWLDGVNATNSLGTRYALWRKGARPVGHIIRGKPYLTECRFEFVPNVGDGTRIARGNQLLMGYGDVFGDAECMIGNRVDDWDMTDGWQVDVDAMDVTYTGPETTATIEVQGTNEANPRNIVARWGSNSATFMAGPLETYYNGTAGNGYTVQQVTDWLNTLPGWSAIVLDNSRRASALSTPGKAGAASGLANVKGVTQRLVTCFDTHGDFYQDRWGGTDENVVIADNLVTNMRGQDLFFAAFVKVKDYLAINNAFHNKTTPTQYAQNQQLYSQLYGPQSHIVWAHNTLATQGALMRTQLPQAYVPDTYCLVANNTLRDLSWNGAPNASLVIRHNHYHAGATPPAGASGSSVGGDDTSLYANAPNADFTPTGALSTNTVSPIVRYDINRTERGAKAPKGAVA